MKKKQRINLMLTAVGAPGAPNIIEMIRKNRIINILGLDINEDVAGKQLVDNFKKNIRGDDPGFARYLLEVAMKENIDVILPLSTDELLNLSRDVHLFQENGINVCISSHETIMIANNKLKAYDFFKNYSFIPKYRKPASLSEMRESIFEMGYPEKPVCIKPHVSHGSRGFRIITNEISRYGYSIDCRPNNSYMNLDTLILSIEAIYGDDFPDIYVVEYLPGDEWGIDIFIDPLTGGKYIATRNNGEVTQSAISKGKMVKNDDLFEIAEVITDNLSFSYGLNIDIKYSEEMLPKVVEINPRLPATIKLVCESGWNFPLMSIMRAFDPSYPIPEIDQLRYGSSIYFYKESMVV